MGRTLAAPDRIRSSERRKLALEMRARGLPYREIGEQLGVSMQAAHRLVVTALEALRTETGEAAADLRTLELERCDKMLAGLWEAATSGDTGAVSAALRVAERRSRLLGLDAPQKAEVSGPAGQPIALEATRLDDADLRALAEIASRVTAS